MSAVNTSVYFDRDVLRVIDAAAEMEEVSRSQFIERAGLKAARESLDELRAPEGA
ncbi:MAG TPA: ribbon-helix-helix protein, CopG family [Gemmatimonadales bacterium]|jgi:uncharacterized protein (DUF1778 family)|nr:ribbon-helix-helix protein, CopG family [Gemmatimonadales bacterium]